ncbi:5-histidylcysteine sulfoxide synthase [Pseudohongiella sp.]|uniref:5-histidylcysteine sulfoxide synthase n=1 Tax=marine sediment metagenome TaxID=412755 RepID=A0A0F9YVF2_9ZZZZ|nr:5-histidylcysteine sulfoxide synthase [Pseudohongiella sp.]HDZ08772.1 5-histidylcysteine sulfoxide synthase [Pseudohongiella sp.]HEA62388.1 5-histidylcysteine sulfoxide synthase [Pseudohongiella sp.]
MTRALADSDTGILEHTRAATSSDDSGSASPSPQGPQQEPRWRGQRAISLPGLDITAGRQALLDYFDNTWKLTETLFSALVSDEAYFVRPYHKTRHPLIFYYVHPVTFYINKLLVAGLLDKPLNPHYEILFETGVDEMSWDDLHEGEQEIWPTVAEARQYRRQVYQAVHQLISLHPEFDQPITMDSPGWALVMCFEHERIHLETSSVLMRELPLKYLRSPTQWPSLPLAGNPAEHVARPVAGLHYPAKNPMIDVAAQDVVVGKPKAWPTFGWDNEYGEDTRAVKSFRASKYLISNGEFYEFVSSGAYLNEQYWSEKGWAWRKFRNTRWPAFWVQDGPVGSHQYKLRTIFTDEPMQWDWPAIVNYYEAKAYCAWRSERDGVETPYRLASEKEHLALHDDEWQLARQPQANDRAFPDHDPVMRDQSALAPGQRAINHNLTFGSEGSVEKFAANNKGFHDVLGNVWQWSEDTFHPLPGFAIHPYYVDFSTPCFDDQHQMIMGGSFISTGDEASVWARFHFRPHFFQHAGFRLVQGDNNAVSQDGGQRYETDALLDQYMLFHWGSRAEQRDEEIKASVGHPDTRMFMETMAELVGDFAKTHGSVLDLGCATGRASFELARRFERVQGLDYSQAFIDAASILQRQGSLAYSRLESGRHVTPMVARVPEKIDRSRVHFIQGDATRLAAAGISADERFDAVLMSNLLCRLPDPAACLRQFTGPDALLRDGGILVLSSPNTWMEQYTPIDAFVDGADSAAALARLGKLLPGYELLHQQDLPFMIREHRRKYEYIVSQVSVWRKKPT